MKPGKKTRAAAFSIGSNILLVVVKLLVGIMSGSVAILAEALHSAIDLLAAIIAFFSIRIADSPADESHPFGHGKAEAISGAIEATLIMVAGVWIIYESVRKLQSGTKLQNIELAFSVMALSALINFFISRYLLKVAKEQDSLALEADGHHLSTDVWTSAGVAVGMGLVWITGFHAMDSVVALLVALWIAFIGLRLTMKATDQLMDRGLPEEELDRIRRLLDGEDRISGWHGLKTRKSGATRQVIVHIECDGQTSLAKAHDIADDLERKIAEQVPPATVDIHMDVYESLKEQDDTDRR